MALYWSRVYWEWWRFADGGKLQHRIIHKNIFFINGREKNDPEINELKSKLVDVAIKQKSWGRRMPMAWVLSCDE
jgi:hypothetical protein